MSAGPFGRNMAQHYGCRGPLEFPAFPGSFNWQFLGCLLTLLAVGLLWAAWVREDKPGELMRNE